MEYLSQLQDWHWFVLGVALLLIEVLGAGGFLIGVAAAAFVLAVVTFVAGIPWQLQLALFGFLAVALTFLYLKVFKRFNDETDSPLLNDRAAQLVGTTIVVEENIPIGGGSVQIGDTRWKVKTTDNILAGSTARIVASEGMVLVIEGNP